MKQYENIPEELKLLPQWVCHRNKVPFNSITGAAAKAGQTVTRARFEDAVFKALWNGEYQSEKCTSESEADLALMGKLLYWCSGNVNAAIEAFINSPYAAGKDDKHTPSWSGRITFKELP